MMATPGPKGSIASAIENVDSSHLGSSMLRGASSCSISEQPFFVTINIVHACCCKKSNRINDDR